MPEINYFELEKLLNNCTEIVIRKLSVNKFEIEVWYPGQEVYISHDTNLKTALIKATEE